MGASDTKRVSFRPSARSKFGSALPRRRFWATRGPDFAATLLPATQASMVFSGPDAVNARPNDGSKIRRGRGPAPRPLPSFAFPVGARLARDRLRCRCRVRTLQDLIQKAVLCKTKSRIVVILGMHQNGGFPDCPFCTCYRGRPWAGPDAGR